MSLRKTILTGLVSALGLTFVPHDAVAQSIVYVDDTATGANDGSSWCDAYGYLQDALAAAAATGGTVNEIRVAQGTYKPDQGANLTLGDRHNAFQLLNGVAIKGGYAGCGEADPDARDVTLYETILSGDLSGDDARVALYAGLARLRLFRRPVRRRVLHHQRQQRREQLSRGD